MRACSRDFTTSSIRDRDSGSLDHPPKVIDSVLLHEDAKNRFDEQERTAPGSVAGPKETGRGEERRETRGEERGGKMRERHRRRLEWRTGSTQAQELSHSSIRGVATPFRFIRRPDANHADVSARSRDVHHIRTTTTATTTTTTATTADNTTAVTTVAAVARQSCYSRAMRENHEGDRRNRRNGQGQPRRAERR